MIDPGHSTRSAITVAGIPGCSTSKALTLASNGENDVSCDDRSYFGGRSDLTAAATVSRAMPRSRATCRCGIPSATSRRINAQSSNHDPSCPRGGTERGGLRLWSYGPSAVMGTMCTPSGRLPPPPFAVTTTSAAGSPCLEVSISAAKSSSPRAASSMTF